MTAVCGGGTSLSRPGFDPAVNYSAIAIAAFLGNIVPPPLNEIIAAIVAQDALDLTTFCSVDPPADPGVTPADYLALLNPAAFSDYWAARNKFIQWWESINWYQACMCATGPTPAPPTPSNPGDGSQNPGLPSGGTSGPCWDISNGYTVPIPTSGTSGFIDATDLLPGAGVVTITPPHTGGVTNAKTIPTGVTTISTVCDGTGTYPGPSVVLTFYTSSGTITGVQQILCDFTNSSSGGHHARTGITVPGTAVSWSVEVQPYFASPTVVQGSIWTMNIEFSYACSTNPNTPVQPCCPPDNSTAFQLNQILNLLSNLSLSINNNAPVTSWVTGAVHAGLSGNGSISIASTAVAVKLVLTTIPSHVGEAIESPTFFFDVGWLTFTTLQGSYPQNQLTFQDTVLTVPLLTDQIDYTLKNGIAATLTELERGP